MPKHWWLDKHEETGGSGELPDYEPYSSDRVSEKTKTRSRWSWRSWHTWQIVLGSALFVLIGGFVWLWIAVGKGMPTLDQLENPHPELATQLVSADGERLDQYFIKNRTTVELR